MPRIKCPKCQDSVEFAASRAGTIVICACGAKLRPAASEPVSARPLEAPLPEVAGAPSPPKRSLFEKVASFRLTPKPPAAVQFPIPPRPAPRSRPEIKPYRGPSVLLKGFLALGFLVGALLCVASFAEAKSVMHECFAALCGIFAMICLIGLIIVNAATDAIQSILNAIDASNDPDFK